MTDDQKKTVSVDEMVMLDRKTISVYGIPGVVLMENAGRVIADTVGSVLSERYPNDDILLKHILVVTGSGNNGGDGFVAARHLHNRGYAVKVMMVGDIARLKADALVNWGIITTMNIHAYQVNNVSPEQVYALVSGSDCIIDALFGIGLNKEVDGIPRRIITQINERDVPVIAADVPSGMNADTGAVQGVAVKAHTTVTMGAIKTGLVADPAKEYVGNIIVADISIPRELF